MRIRFLRYLTLFSFVFILIAGCSQTLFGARIGYSAQAIYEQTSTYYPLNLSKTIMRTDSPDADDPDHELILEGIGWQNDQLFVVLTTSYRDRRLYLDSLSMNKVSLTYKDQTLPLTQKRWEEGYAGRYGDSCYRYALAFEKSATLPVGTWPTQVQVDDTTFALPTEPPAPAAHPAQYQLKAKLKAKDLPNKIESNYLSYQVTEFVASEDEQRLKLLVTSDMSGVESSSFLLKDDKGRIYPFDPETLPKSYSLGEEEFDLMITQTLPADIKHLRLIIFEADNEGPHKYAVLDEASIRLF